MIKAVILDLNGIFLEAEYLSDRLEEEYGIPGDKTWKALKEVLVKTRKPNSKPFFKLLKPHLKRLSLEISENEFFKFWYEGEKFNPKALEFVKSLKKKGLKVFILSRNFKERTDYYRKNIPQLFETVDKSYFSWETGLVKPDPSAYKAILEEHDLRPEECLYFDDSKKNVESARKLGINAFVYENIDKAKKTISSFLEKPLS